MTEPNKLDGQIDEIVEDAIGTGVAWIPSGKSEKWLQIGRETATKQLKTLFTEHSKQEVELAKLQMSADIFTQFKDAIMRQDLSPRPIHGTRFLTPLEELALILERQAPLSKRNK